MHFIFIKIRNYIDMIEQILFPWTNTILVSKIYIRVQNVLVHAVTYTKK